MTDDEYKAKYGWFDNDAHNGINAILPHDRTLLRLENRDMDYA